jgi:hypothetical protein
MNIINKNAVPFANKLITYYQKDGAVITLFDSDFGAIWFAAFIAKRDQVELLENPKSSTANMSASTKSCNKYMDSMLDNLTVLEYQLKKCIKAGSITDSYNSFMISQIRKSIKIRNYEKFSFYFPTLKDLILVPANKAALIAVGFTNSKINALISLYNKAAIASTSFTFTETQRVNLVPVNNKAYKELKKMCSDLVRVGFTCFSDPIIKSKRKLYVMANIIKLIRPTPPSKPVDKHFSPTERRILFARLSNRWTCEFTFKKGKGTMTIGRALTKNGIPSATEDLPFGKKISKLKSEYPGEGEYFIVTYSGFDKAIVTTNIIK